MFHMKQFLGQADYFFVRCVKRSIHLKGTNTNYAKENSRGGHWPSAVLPDCFTRTSDARPYRCIT